jgi:hypothetical protein
MKCTKNAHQRTSHTPEPWHHQMEYRITTIFAPDHTGDEPHGTYIAEIDGQDVGRFTTSEQHEANARRICAAVNACEGIPTDALESGPVRELLKLIAGMIANTHSNKERN